MDEIESLEEGEIREDDDGEIEIWKKRVTELETQALMIKNQAELGKIEIEEAMEVYKIQYDGLSVKLEVREMEFEDLILIKKSVDDELKVYKTRCDGLNQRISCLEQLKMKEIEEINQLKKGKRDLECGYGREEDEVEAWKRRLREFENQSALKQKNEVGLVKGLEACRNKCDGFFDVHEELHNYKQMYNGLEEWVFRLNEDRKVMFERENWAQERITYLEKELKKKEGDEREKYVELWIQNRDLMCGKTRAEDEIDVWKKRFGELDTQAALKLKQAEFEKGELAKVLEEYRVKCHALSVELVESKMECVGIEGKLKDLMLAKGVVDDELKGYMTTCNQLKERIMDLEEGEKVLREKEKRAQERVTYLEEEIENIEFNERDKYCELTMEYKNLEHAKSSVENEINIWKKRSSDLETGLLRMKQVELEKAELEKEFDILLTKYDAVSMELEEKKMKCVLVEDKLEALLLRKSDIEHELKEYKSTCNGLNERIMGLEEDQKIILEKEKRAQDRITYLEEKIKQMESDEREHYAQLKKESMVLECEKRSAEDETEIWKKRFGEVKTLVLTVEDENSTLRCIDSQISGRIEFESGGLQSEACSNDKLDKYRNVKLQSETDGRADGAHVAHFEIKEKMLNNKEKILTSSFVDRNHPSSHQGDKEVHISVPASATLLSKPLVNFKEKKKITPLETKVEFQRIQTRVRQGSVTPISCGIVDISDCEDEKELTPNHTCSVRGKETVHLSTDYTLQRSSCNEKDVESQRCLKRLSSDQGGEEYGSSYDEYIPRSSNPKRRASVVVTSESESEDDGRIPISKFLMKNHEKQNEGVHKLPPLNLSGGIGAQNVEEHISPLRQILIPLRQCEEKKNWAERTSRSERTSQNHLQISGISYQKAGRPTSENEKENVAENVGLHSESASLGAKWSDDSDNEDSSSDSEDESEIHLAFDQVMAMIRKNRLMESNWQFEADMLSSFEVDSELCMKAVCALYRQQIPKEKLMKGSLNSNNKGFNKYDALRGATLAEFLMDGNKEGDLKKSVQELELFDPKALEECRRLANHYSKQLFTLYQNKEDPFFHPNSIGRSDQSASSGRV